MAIPSYDLLGLNVKIADKPLTRRILDKDTGLIYGEHEHTLTNMVKNVDS